MKKRVIYDIETFGLESMTDRVVSIGVFDILTEEKKVFISIDEEKMLEEFWAYAQDVEELWGFNSDSFDLPFLIKRSLIKKVKLPIKLPKSVDLRKIVNGFWVSYEKFGKGTLREWAEVLGCPCETQAGNEMPALFVKGDFDAIIKHNEEDLVITHKLYKLAEYCNLVK
jgi:uncharacterized protein YprB with RNaseH-like and TPR domain